MSKRYDAFIAKDVNSKSYWTKIGAMFENRSGNGFSLILDAIPPTVDGAYRVSLFEPKENDRGSNNNNNSGGGYQNNNSGGGGYSSGRPGSNRGQSQDDYGSKPDHGQDDDIPF